MDSEATLTVLLKDGGSAPPAPGPTKNYVPSASSGGTPPPGSAPFDPFASARKQMQTEVQAQAVKAARMSIDPDFANKEHTREAKLRNEALQAQAREAAKKADAEWKAGVIDPLDKLGDILHFTGQNWLGSLVKAGSAFAGMPGDPLGIGKMMGMKRPTGTSIPDVVPTVQGAKGGATQTAIQPGAAKSVMPAGGVAAGGSAAGAGAMGGLAAAAPIGIAIAAAGAIEGAMKSAVDSAVEPIQKFGTAIGSFDAHALTRASFDYVEKLGIAGYAVSKFGGAVLDVTEAVSNYVKKISQYSGLLAQQEAMIEVQNLRRDINRAQNMGPDFARFVEARNNVEQKLQDIMDKIAPPMLRALTGILNFVEMNANAAEAVLEGVLAIVEYLQKDPVGQALLVAVNPLGALLGQLVRHTEPPPAAGVDLFDVLRLRRDPAETEVARDRIFAEEAARQRERARRRASPFGGI